MTNPKILICYNQPLIWPNECVACGAKATKKASASGARIASAGYWVIFISVKYKTIRIRFPVCTKHWIIYRVMRAAYFVCFLGLLFTLGGCLPAWLMNSNSLSLYSWMVAIIIAVISIVGFLWAWLYAPVRVSPKKNSCALKIRNEMYRSKFIGVNNLLDIVRVS